MPLTIDQDGNALNSFDFTHLLEDSLGLDRVEASENNEQVVRAIILYNPLDYSDRTVCDLVWEQEKTLDAYFDGLPDADWTVSIGSLVVDREDWGKITLAPLDTVVIGVTPNQKILPILMIVAMVALVALGPAGWGGIGLLTVTQVAWIGVGLAIASFIATSLLADKPKDPGSESNKQSQSYGLDGPKNTSSETVSVPTVYGEMRIAGNKTNVYVENNPDKLTQTLFLQYVVSEGEIESITDLRLNDQPIGNFQFAIMDWRSGTQTQLPMQWFSETISPFNVQAKVSPSHYAYETTDEVDRVRVDFAFGNGLYSVNEKTGGLVDATVALRATYAKINSDGSYQAPVLLNSGPAWTRIDASTGTFETPISGLRVTVQVTGADHEPNTPYSTGAYYRPGGTEGWTSVGSDAGYIQNVQFVDASGSIDYSAGSLFRVFEVVFLENITEFYAEGGVIVGVEALYPTSLTYTDRTRGTIRHSFTTPPLERGRYRFEFWRDALESTDSKLSDSIVITDINQIKDDLIRYANTAFYGVQVQLGSDINQEPNCTVLVKGKKVNIYDRNGNIAEYRWSDNPADIALDVMLNPRHRFAFNTTRIDFSAFDNWRIFCAQNNLKFNGTFDAVTNVWDALLGIMRVGRGSPILQGLRWSVLMEGPADPVMMFTQDNMIKGSFSSKWAGRKDRANLIEVQYFDRLDGYKQHSVFALDDSFIAQGEAMVQTTLQLRGVTDGQQALNEANLQLNLNRYLTQAVDFDVYLQAMGCVVGDVILVQHDMPAWGYSGRITDASTFGQVTIDSDVPFNGGSDWRLLLVRGIAELVRGAVTGVSGKQIQIGGFGMAVPDVWDSALIAYSGEDASIINPVAADPARALDIIRANGIDRVMVYGHDYEIVDWAIIGDQVILVSNEVFQANLNDPVRVFKNDVMCEANLVAPQYNDRVLKFNGWNSLNGAPRNGDIVMIGQVEKFKKPFRILKITYKDDHTRTISALEYNDSVYGPNAHATPNYSALQLAPYQVDNLRGKQVATQLQGGAMRYQAHFDWDRPLNDPRGYAGSKLYSSVNFSQFDLVADAPNPISSFDIDAQVGDIVRLKVVAYERSTETANYASAPIAAVEIGTHSQKPQVISGLEATGGVRQIALRWNPVTDDFVKEYEVWENTTGDLGSAYLMYRGKQNYFVRAGLNPKETRTYWVRTIAITEQPGDFIGPVSATSSELIASDIQNGILDTAKFADSISPVGVYDGVPQTLTDTGGAKVAINTQDGKLYRWNGIKFTTLIDPVDVPGVALNSDVQAINQALTTQYLTKQQTDDLFAARDAGTLTQEQIEQIRSATVSGLLPDARLNASNIEGQLTQDQIASLDFSKLTGVLDASKIVEIDPATGNPTTGISGTRLFGEIKQDVIPVIPTSKLTGDILASSSATLNLAGANITGALSAAHVASLDALNGKVTSTQISDNAVSAPMIQAGAVNAKLVNAYALNAENIAAGQITAEKLAVGSPNNSITNSCFYLSDEGWGKGGVTVTPVIGTANESSYGLDGLGSALITSTSPLSPDQYADCYWTNSETGTRRVFNCPVPAQPGETWEAQLSFYSSHGFVECFLLFVDGQGAILSSPSTGPQIFAPDANVHSLSDWKTIAVRRNAPAGTVAVGLLIRLRNNENNSSVCAAFVSRTLLGRTTPNATENLPWTPGGIVSVTGGIVRSNAIVARHIVAGEVKTDKLDAGAVTAEKLAIGSSTNAIWNPCCVVSTDGWAFDGNIPVTGGYALNGFILAGEGTGYVNATGTLSLYQNITASWRPGGYGMPIRGGDWIEAQALIASHRCASFVQIHFLDENGTVLQVTSSERFVTNGGGSNIASYNLAWAKAQSPGAATFAKLVIVGANDGGNDFYGVDTNLTAGQYPFVFFTRAAIGVSTPVAKVLSVPQPWSPGGITTITGGVLKSDTIVGRHISANVITSDKIGANEVQARNIAAGQVTAEKLAVGSANNVIWNSCILTNNSGWIYGGNGVTAVFVPVVGTSYESNWLEPTFGTGLLTTSTPSAALTSSQIIDLVWSPNAARGATGIPAEAGQCWCWQTRVISIGCTAQLFIQFIGVNGSVINSVQSQPLAYNPASGKSLSDYAKLFVRGVAPIGTKWVYATLRAGYLNGASGGPAVLMTQASLGLSNPNAVGIDPWVPGGVTQINGGMIETGSIRAGQLDVDDVQAKVVTATTIKAKLVGADQLVANNIAANAITSDKIGANQVLAQNIASGQITTEKLAVGSANNMIWNSCFELESDGWNFVSPQPITMKGAVINTSLNGAWNLTGSGTGVISTANISGGEFMDAVWIPDGQGVPVQPGQWYVGQAQVVTHRCANQVIIAWIDGNGNQVGAATSGTVAYAQPANGLTLNNYNLNWVCGQAPPTAIYARLVIRGFNSGSGFGTGANPFLFFTQCSFGQSWSRVTEPPPFALGGVTKLSGGAIQTNAIYARHVAAGQITTEKLSVGSGNTIWNGTCINGLDGWNVGGFGGLESSNSFLLSGSAQSITGNGNRTLIGYGSGCVVFNSQTPIPANQGFTTAWVPSGYAPVLGGKRYQAAALLQPHRINARVDIVFLDANGNYAGEINGNTIGDLSANAHAVIEFEYQRSAVVGKAPSNATSAYMRWIAFPSQGASSTNPYVFFTKAMFSEAPPNATEVGAWSPGGVTEISGGVIKTNTVQARHMQANSISADSLQANSVIFGKVAAGAIRAAQIRSGEIRTDHLAADFALINTAQIGDAIISNAKIGNLQVDGNKIYPGSATGAQYSRNTYRGNPQTWVTYAAVAAHFDQYATGALIFINCQNDYQGESTNLYQAPTREGGGGSTGGSG